MVEMDRPKSWGLPQCCGTCGQWLSDTMVLPSAVVALSMKFFANYLLCVDSLSIILSAECAHDIIFDGLAIAFVSDLGEDWRKFLEHALKFESFEDVKSMRSPSAEVWNNDASLTDEAKTRTMYPSLISALSRSTSIPEGSRLWDLCVRPKEDANARRDSIFSIGYGGNRIMHFLAMIALMSIYGRQLLVMLQAFETGKLPAARDLCAEYRLLVSMQSKISNRTWRFETLNVLRDTFEATLEETLDEQMMKFYNTTNPLRRDCVEKNLLNRLSFTDQLLLVKSHCRLVSAFAAVGVFVLVIPKFMRCMADARSNDASYMLQRMQERDQQLLEDECHP